MEDCLEKAIEIASNLRDNDINTQVYLEKVKLGRSLAMQIN